jgi:ubiquinone/menaquinone biosynthesis C-methylase UbiE
MISTRKSRRPRGRERRPHFGGFRRKLFNRLLESDLIREVSFEEYRDRVRHVYRGPRGAFLAACSLISLHVPLGERLFRKRKFDLRGARRILDVGSGAGQIVQHLLKYADPEASITGMDLSHDMLRRARRRLENAKPRLLVADLSRLPFADGAFDCVTCGYVLEHLPEARIGLAELSRVMAPGAKLLLMTTEDTFSGAWTSRIWCCRTYNRRELVRICNEVGLKWNRELWLSGLHRVFRAGGICAELVKR